MEERGCRRWAGWVEDEMFMALLWPLESLAGKPFANLRGK